MKFERIKAEGLAHNSYFVATDSAAIVIDPRRDCQVYVDLAEKYGVTIAYILETHCNEDFLIGSVELNNLTGAGIYHGPGLQWGYGTTLEDGDEFELGPLRLRAVHTPGHTVESICYVLHDLSQGPAPVMVFSGDTLFINEVGRTDLYGAERSAEQASALYHSLFEKVLPLGDGVILCPAHGAGSVCGFNIGNRDESTIGTERQQNRVLQHKGKDDFVAFMVGKKAEIAPYFSRIEETNRSGPPLLGFMPSLTPLDPAEFRQEMERGAVVIDTSGPAPFAAAHIRESYSLDREVLPLYAGWVVKHDQPILVVMEDLSHLDEVTRHLIRLGYDNVRGYLAGGIRAWSEAGMPMEHAPPLTVHALKGSLDRDERLSVLDVRTEAEWEQGHIPAARHEYVGYLPEKASSIPADRPVAVLCSTGTRASLASSILLRQGFTEVHAVLGSMKAWMAAGYPVARD